MKISSAVISANWIGKPIKRCTCQYMYQIIISYVPETLTVQELDVLAVEIKIVSWGVTVTSRSYVPALVTFKGLNFRVILLWRWAYWRVNNSNSFIFISAHYRALSIPIPDSLYGDWSVHHIIRARVMLQVKIRVRPWKKLVFRWDPEIMGGGGTTACNKMKSILQHRYNDNRSVHWIETLNLFCYFQRHPLQPLGSRVWQCRCIFQHDWSAERGRIGQEVLRQCHSID